MINQVETAAFAAKKFKVCLKVAQHFRRTFQKQLSLNDVSFDYNNVIFSILFFFNCLII